MAGLAVRLLDEATWPDFAALAERHNGVWGGCWCLAFHAEGYQRGPSYAERREMKLRRVREGTTHSALVYDGEACVGWCQFGPAAELPRIKSARAYAKDLAAAPDWRITCFFIDKARRGQGVAQAALAGALDAIAKAGGGVVESYPEDIQGRYGAAFLHNGTLAMFERQGFARDRLIGKNRWVVTKVVAPAA